MQRLAMLRIPSAPHGYRIGILVNWDKMLIRPCGHISSAQMAKARIWHIARYAAAVFA